MSDEDRDTPRTYDLAAVLRAAERAEEQMADWPQWKRELSRAYASRDIRREDTP